MFKRHWVETQNKVAALFDSAHIVITPEERAKIEIADFGLDHYETEGLGLITYINNDMYCAKELALLPHQTCPEHRHPAIELEDGTRISGKTETFRCRWGKVWLYVDGVPVTNIQASVPKESQPFYTVFYEIELHPGSQFTIPPNTLHWFQAGESGAVVSEFSTTSRDELDIFTDTRIVRTPNVAND